MTVLRNLVYAAGACLLAIVPARAQEAAVCGEPYTIRAGDTLTGISLRLYGDAALWTRLLDANSAVFGDNPERILAGQVINAPCGEGNPARAVAAPAPDTALAPASAPEQAAAPAEAEEETALTILVADDFHPFTDRSLPEGGLATDVAAAALRGASVRHRIDWVNDRGAHLDPLLHEGLFQMGLPWPRPQCTDDPERFECASFHYSLPIFEALIQFFVLRDSDFRFEVDDDVIGRVICHPAGHALHYFDEGGRHWLRDEKITLLKSPGVASCFDLLLDGKVDAVAVNEFTGRTVVATQGLDDRVRSVDRAVSLQSLHAVTARANPLGVRWIDTFNRALETLMETGDYNAIVSEHLALFWRDNG